MAAKFHFRFKTVELVRERKEREVLARLSGAQRGYMESIQKKNENISKIKNTISTMTSLASQPAHTNVMNFKTHEEYLGGLKIMNGKLDLQIMKARKKLEKVLKEYLLAKRSLKSIQKVREKDFEEFKRAQRKREQKETDDLYTQRAGIAS